MIISSVSNEKVKYYSKLLRHKKYRDMEGKFVVEGMHLVMEASRAGILEEVLVLEDEVIPIDVPVLEVTYDVLKKICDVKTPSKIVGLCHKGKNKIVGRRILLLDEIQDPGNLGTIIRSAVAFNISSIVVGRNSCDLYSPKVIRGTQGMLFHIPIIECDLGEVIPKLKEDKITVLVTNVNYGEDIRKLKREVKNNFALIMGNEGNGVNPIYMEEADKAIYIPMNDVVESLNVAVATSIILYELEVCDE